MPFFAVVTKKHLTSSSVTVFVTIRTRSSATVVLIAKLGKGAKMIRPILQVVTMALTLLVASGVALALTKIGTDGPNALRGTKADDNLVGKGANDTLIGSAQEA
jgi:hypothetical protein